MKILQVSPWTKAVVLGVLGAGVAGNGVATYITNQNHASEVAKLTQDRSNDLVTIKDLTSKSQDEHAKNEDQAKRMSQLTQELEQSKITNLSLFEKIQQEHGTLSSLSERSQKDQATIEHLTKQVNGLNKDLNSRITLDQMITAVNMVTPSTVIVEGEAEMFNHFTGKTEKIRGNGSGVILVFNGAERFIITNGHVTEGHEIRNNPFKDGVYHIKVYNGSDYSAPVEFDAPPVILSNGNRAFSPPREQHDLALLAIPPDVNLPDNVGVKIRDIKKHPLQVGEPVITIGAPFGLRDSVSIGSISHIDRELKQANINHHIQMDAASNPGNSGGGLFSVRVEDGKPIVELVGINNWGYGPGVNHSIRIDFLEKVFNDWKIAIK